MTTIPTSILRQEFLDANPAQSWAWDQVSSPNLDFTGGPVDLALVLLAFARLADEALNSPNGYGWTAASEVATRIKADPGLVSDAAHLLVRCGLLVKTSPTGAMFLGFRVPEEAFGA